MSMSVSALYSLKEIMQTGSVYYLFYNLLFGKHSELPPRASKSNESS